MATAPTAPAPIKKTPEQALRYFRTGPNTLETLKANGFKVILQSDFDAMVKAIMLTEKYFKACAAVYEEHGPEAVPPASQETLDLIIAEAQTAIAVATGSTPATS